MAVKITSREEPQMAEDIFFARYAHLIGSSLIRNPGNWNKKERVYKWKMIE